MCTGTATFTAVGGNQAMGNGALYSQYPQQGVNPTLTLVANSLGVELKGCEVGAAGWSKRGTVQPCSDAEQVDGRGREDMLQMGLGEPAIAYPMKPQ